MKKKTKKQVQLKKPKMFNVSAEITLHCVMPIEAETEDEAIELARERGGDEWLSWVSGPESIDVEWAEERN